MKHYDYCTLKNIVISIELHQLASISSNKSITSIIAYLLYRLGLLRIISEIFTMRETYVCNIRSMTYINEDDIHMMVMMEMMIMVMMIMVRTILNHC